MHTGNMGKLLSIDARGKFGYSGGFGRLTFSYNRFGFSSPLCGIYQKQYYYGKPYIARMRFYRSKNPRTISQQNWRFIFKYLRGAWYALNPAQKKVWRLIGDKKHMTGFNALMSQNLKRPTGGFGKLVFSWNVFGFHF